MSGSSDVDAFRSRRISVTRRTGEGGEMNDGARLHLGEEAIDSLRIGDIDRPAPWQRGASHCHHIEICTRLASECGPDATTGARDENRRSGHLIANPMPRNSSTASSGEIEYERVRSRSASTLATNAALSYSFSPRTTKIF